MTETHTDCRSEEGITVGLIDAILTISRILATRDLCTPAVYEALKDFNDDKDIQALIETAKLADTYQH